MNEATDLSLEADHLEELLEAPVASPPVVMIEYRNRGVPWWLLGPVLVLVPALVGAVFYYQHSVVERLRAKAAKAEYIQKVQAVEQAAATKSVAPSPTPVSVLADIADPAVLQVAGPAEAGATAKGAPAPAAEIPKAVDVELGTAAVGSPTTGALEPARPRVRSMTRSPFDTDDEPPSANGAGTESVAAPKEAPGDASGAKLAMTPKDARAGDKSTTSSDANAGTPAAQSPGAAVAQAAVGAGAAAPAVEPLPNAEEFLNQSTEEAATKERELAEQERANALRARDAMNEERVKFHQELQEILDVHGKNAGEEIDALVRRSQKLHDPRIFSRAKSVWRQVRLPAQTKVNQIRALEICEPAILNLISEPLKKRMRSPGGPRDDNEVRVKAAQILLSCKLPGATESPESSSASSKDLKERGTGGAGPQ